MRHRKDCEDVVDVACVAATTTISDQGRTCASVFDSAVVAASRRRSRTIVVVITRAVAARLADDGRRVRIGAGGDDHHDEVGRRHLAHERRDLMIRARVSSSITFTTRDVGFGV